MARWRYFPMERQGLMKRIRGIAVVSGLLVIGLSVLNCTSSPDRRADERDSGPEQIVGAPPQPGDADYEFAIPPEHPGTPKPIGGAPTREWDATASIIDRHYIERLRYFGPSLVLQHIQTDPAHDDDGFVGFEIIEISPAAEQYLTPRLQRGDIITHVNLVQIEKPDDYMEAWKTLEDAEEIRIDFVRDGEPADVIWDVE